MALHTTTSITHNAVAAPAPYLRFPGYLGPALYGVTVVYSLFSNLLMVAVGLEIDAPNGRLGPVSGVRRDVARRSSRTLVHSPSRTPVLAYLRTLTLR